MLTDKEKQAAYEKTLEFLSTIGIVEIRNVDFYGNKDGKLACYPY